MRRIAAFLDIPVDEAQWETILEYCSFEWMKRHATKSVPLGGTFWDGGAQVFINQGVNGRWADTLTPEDVAEYEARGAGARPRMRAMARNRRAGRELTFVTCVGTS